VPSVTRRPRRKRAPYPHLEAHPAARRRETPHVGLRRARSAGPAAGLERRTPGEPEHLPSDWPGSYDPGRLVAFVVHSHDVATAPCRLPRAWATSSKDGWSRHAIPARCASPRVAPRRAARREKDASHRLLQPTYDPSTQRTVRFPVRSPSRFATLAGLLQGDSRQPTLGQWPPVSPQVKLRLTANLQLRPCRNPSPLARARVTPIATAGVMPRGPGGASIERSSRAAPPGRGVFNREPSLRRSL